MNIEEIKSLRQLDPNAPNFIAEKFSILHIEHDCPHCSKRTEAVGIVLSEYKEHVPLEEEDEPDYTHNFSQEELDAWCETEEAHQWEESDIPYLIINLMSISKKASQVIHETFPNAFLGMTKLENHCIHCKKLLNDEYCFQISGPFMSELSKITLVDIDEPIQCKGSGVFNSVVADFFDD